MKKLITLLLILFAVNITARDTTFIDLGVIYMQPDTTSEVTWNLTDSTSGYVILGGDTIWWTYEQPQKGYATAAQIEYIENSFGTVIRNTTTKPDWETPEPYNVSGLWHIPTDTDTSFEYDTTFIFNGGGILSPPESFEGYIVFEPGDTVRWVYIVPKPRVVCNCMDTIIIKSNSIIYLDCKARSDGTIVSNFIIVNTGEYNVTFTADFDILFDGGFHALKPFGNTRILGHGYINEHVYMFIEWGDGDGLYVSDYLLKWNEQQLHSGGYGEILKLDGLGNFEWINPDPVIKLSDIEKWIEYCYNDSTQVITHECPDGRIGCLVYHTWYKWQHKDPNDPVGFVKWIKENK